MNKKQENKISRKDFKELINELEWTTLEVLSFRAELKERDKKDGKNATILSNMHCRLHSIKNNLAYIKKHMA